MAASTNRLLVVTARRYEAEAVVGSGRAPTVERFGGMDALHSGLGSADVTCVISDVGPIQSALATARALHEDATFDAVISAGIGGAFAGKGLGVGDLVVATQLHHGDFGVESGDGFEPAQALDWPIGSYRCDEQLSNRLAVNAARRGDILTVTRQSTSASRIADLQRIWPAALAEAMEGIGVAAAAATRSLPMTEVRAISNLVGPRDQYPWNKDLALERLAEAFSQL